MKLFLFISILFHGVILSILFSWRIPLVDTLFPRSVIEVSLIAMVEEKASEIRVPLPAPKKKKIKPQPVEKKGEPPKEIEVKKLPLSQKPEAPKPIQEPVPEKIKREESPPPQSSPEKEKREENPPPRSSPEKIRKEEDPSPGPAPEKTPVERASGGGTDISASGANAPSTPLPGASLIPAVNPGIPLGGGPMGQGPGDKKGEGRDSGAGPRESAKLSKVQDSPGGVDETLLLILRKIEAAKKYPRIARKMGTEGKTTVRFKLRSNGEIDEIQILESSGSEILDQTSLQTVRDAAPLPYKEGWLKVGILFKMK